MRVGGKNRQCEHVPRVTIDALIHEYVVAVVTYSVTFCNCYNWVTTPLISLLR